MLNPMNSLPHPTPQNKKTKHRKKACEKKKKHHEVCTAVLGTLV